MGSVVGCLAVHTKGVKAYLPTIKAIADKLIAKGKSPEEAWTKATESQIKSLTGELEKTHKAIVKKYEAEHGEIKAPDTPERRALDRSAEAYASDMKEKRYASDMKEKRSAQRAEDARARASEKPKTDTVGTPAEPWVDAAARMRASVRGEGEIGKTPERTQQVEDTLRGAFHDPAGFDKVIGVVHDEHDPRLPPDVRETLHSSDAKVQAMYDPKTKKTWVLAHNVPEGRELGVALHEIGVHMGMKNFLGRENYHKLVGQLRSWAAEGKGKEGELARKARDRVLQAEEKLGKKYDPETFNEEHLAYFVEEAVKDGIDPTAVKGTTQINRWFRTLWAAAKAAVRKLGMDPSKLTAQHVVDMAYGAARLELNGTWHGTAAEFRRFDHSHMGTGEGVQAYGHGTYLAQGVGIAKEYHLADVERKGGFEKSGWTLDGKPFDQDDVDKVATNNERLALQWFVDQHPSGNSARAIETQMIQMGKPGLAAWVKKNASRIGKEPPRGNLMRVDVNAGDHEYLDLDKPLSEQSPHVQKALEDAKAKLEKAGVLDDYLYHKNAEWGELTGKEMYRQILSKARKDELIEHPDDTARTVPNDEAVSHYLDSIGIKGNKFLDANSRHSDYTKEIARKEKYLAQLKDDEYEHWNVHEDRSMTPEELRNDIESRTTELANLKEANAKGKTHNLVIFNEKNIHRAFSEPGADKNARKFSVSDKVKESAKDKLLTPAKRYWRELGNTMAKQGPKALTNAQLAEQYGDRLPSLATHHELLNRVSMEQRRILHEAHRVIPEWSKLSDEDLNRVHEVMHDATMQGMHPDEAFGKGGNDHLTSGADLVKYNKLRTLFSSLSPDAKAVYTKSRDILKDLHEQELEFHAGVTKAVYKPLIDAAWKSGDTKEAARLLKVQSKDIAESTKDIKSVKGPYFPLMRFGDHVAIVKSPEFVKNQGALEGLSGKEHTAAVDALDAMKKDPKHYEVQSFDKISDAEKFRDDQMSKGMTGEVKLADEHFASERPVSAAGLEKINHLMESQFDSATGRKVKEVMTAMYLASLPDRAAMKRRVGRIGVAGASKDMLRAFAESTERSAFHMSRLKYTKDIAANMFKMKQEARDAGTDMQHVHQNVQARLALDYTYTPNNPLVNGIASLSSMYHLTMSPSFLVQNALQTHLITAPELAGRHGMPKTLKALNAAWVDASKIIPAGKGGVFNLNDMDLGHMTAGHERDMLEHMRGLGQLEITQNQDMGMLAVGHSPTMVKATQVANWATHHTELHNRITTALAAYRLELGKKPGDYEGAKKAAYTALMRTQLDYSRENSPYAMRAGKINQAVGPLIWQFRKFQQGMTYLLLDNAKKAWGGDKEARRSLMYLMGAQAAVAGLRGIPFIMAPLAVANWFSSDDDKDGNVETQLRNYTADLLGPAASRVLWKGAPNLAGADMSNSLGMGTMFFPVPYTDMHDIAKQKTGEMKLLKAVGAVAGAWTGTASQILDAISYFNEGNMTKGFEKALPKVLASPVKAWDISENGMTTPNGAVTMPADKFDAVDIFLKSMGLQSTVESEHYEAQKVKGNASQAIHDKAKSLKDQYVAAVLKGESLSGVREDVAAFNLAHPNNRVLPQDLLQSVAARRRIQATGTDDAGVGFRKNEAELKGIDNFAK